MKTVFLTGAASGIGRATAQALYERDYVLGLADKDIAGLQALTSNWDRVRFDLYEMDITNREQVDTSIKAFAHKNNDQLDILINNAGVLFMGEFDTIPFDKHQLTFDVNVLGLMQLTYAAFPYLKASNGAIVINLSSASSSYGIPELASYSASKFAVKGFTEALELEWRAHNIHVVDVVPPFVNTHMVNSQNQSAKILDTMGVDLEAVDVAHVILKQIDQPRLHRAVGWQFKLLHTLSDFMPNWSQRILIKIMSAR